MALSGAERSRRYIPRLEAAAGIDTEDAEMKAERKAQSLRHTGYLPMSVRKGRLAVHNRVDGNGHRTWTVDDCPLAHELYERCGCG
jgi:hypothetical protein